MCVFYWAFFFSLGKLWVYPFCPTQLGAVISLHSLWPPGHSAPSGSASLHRSSCSRPGESQITAPGPNPTHHLLLPIKIQWSMVSTSVCMQTVCGYLPSIMTDLSICYRDHIAHKAKNIYYLTPSQEKWAYQPTPYSRLMLSSDSSVK